MSNNFVEAAFDATTKAVQFKATDGRILVRSGGSLCWRTNNCGNLASPVEGGQPTPKKTKNYIGFAKVENPEEHYFFIFPSYEEGREQLRQSINRKHAQRTIPELIKQYAPKHENNTQRYTDFVLAKTGLSTATKIADMSAANIESIIDAIEAMEGYNNHAETQNETWLTVSELAASDGAAPIPGASIRLNQGGKTRTLKADETGRFPTVVHPKPGEPSLDIEVPTKDGLWKKALSLTHQSKPTTGIFILDLLVAIAPMLSHAAPPNTKSRKIPVHYRVKAGDTLEKIAGRYKSTVAEIKKLNDLASADVHPEQMLWIYGKGIPNKARKAKAAVPTKPVAPAKAAEPTKEAPAEGLFGNFRDWLNPTPSDLARSKDGEGAPLALINPDDKRAPWMKFAVKEAKKWAGKKEDVIETSTNYHQETGFKNNSMSGTLNAWCASFANWCFQNAGYAKWTPSMRARAIKDDANFVEIDMPVYGAVALIGTHHVTFVYGIDIHSKYVVALGGNQDDKINFSVFEESTKYFIPLSYKKYAEMEMRKNDLLKLDAKKLNLEFGIPVKNKIKQSTR